MSGDTLGSAVLHVAHDAAQSFKTELPQSRIVRGLFAIPSAGQAPGVFTFAAGADADRRAEILRMRWVLNAISNGGSKS